MRAADKRCMGEAKAWNRTKGELIAGRVEVANTSALRRKGLLRHDRLDAGQGLWIVPCEGVHTFGMKFAIDIVFLSRDKKVLKIQRGLRRGRISLCLRAHSALELPGNSTDNLDRGDQIEFERVA